MSLENLVYSMINRKDLTLKLELRNYIKITHPGVEIYKAGYLKQRMKLNPEAFKVLYQSHNKNFYQDTEIEPYTYKGYLVLAADGSDINIPTTAETIEGSAFFVLFVLFFFFPIITFLPKQHLYKNRENKKWSRRKSGR